MESGKKELGNTMYMMPETTSKDDIIGREDSFPCKSMQFIIYSSVAHKKIILIKSKKILRAIIDIILFILVMFALPAVGKKHT